MTIAGRNAVNVLVMLVKLIEDRLAHFPSFAGRISKNWSTPQPKSHAKRLRNFHPKSAQPIPKPNRAFQDPPTQIISRNTGGLGRLHGWWRGAGMLRILWCLDGRLGDGFSFTWDVVMLFKWVGRCWNYWYQLGFWSWFDCLTV